MCFIVFIRRTPNEDTIMRGVLPTMATEELQLRCRSKLITVGWFANIPQLNGTLSGLFAAAPKPHICYFIKELWGGPEPELCHRVGAYTLFD
eukprot:4714641-Prymnesium_polylepis.1